MAAESAGVREAGFCVLEGTGGGVRGWLFLAWVSPAWDVAEAERGVLAGEAGAEQGAGSVGVADVAAGGVAGGADLGACAHEGEDLKFEICPCGRPPGENRGKGARLTTTEHQLTRIKGCLGHRIWDYGRGWRRGGWFHGGRGWRCCCGWVSPQPRSGGGFAGMVNGMGHADADADGTGFQP